MLYILHNNLNENEFISINNTFEHLDLEYTFCNVNSVELPSLQELNENKVIVLYEEVKSKSVFEKRFESHYGTDVTSLMLYIRVDKPSTYMKDQENKVKSIGALLDFVESKTKTINMSLFPAKVGDYRDVVSAINNSRVYVFSGPAGTLEVRPEGFESGTDVDESVTYTEFMTIIAVKHVVGFEKVTINKR